MGDWITQVAKSVPFDNSTNGFVSEDVQAAIEEAKDTAIGALEFEAFESTPEESTTSNFWVTKSSYPYTTSTLSAGTHLLQYSAQMGQSDKQKRVGMRFQYREVGDIMWTTLVDVRDGLSVDDQWELRTGFNLIVLTSDTAIEVRFQWGQTGDGGIGRIRNAAFNTERVL